MGAVQDPLGGLTAAQVALLLVAVQYAVLAPGWVVAALMLPGEKRAALWCATYAAASGLGLALIVWGMHAQWPLPRGAGNALAIGGMLALQRGVWAFSGQPPWTKVQAVVLAVTVLLSYLAAVSEGQFGAWRVAVVSALWGGIYAWCAHDVWRYIQHQPKLRLGLLCVTPLLAGAVLLGLRALRAVVAPETVMAEVSQDSWLSVGSAIVGLVAALVLQLTLVGLLVARMVVRMEQLSRHDALTGLLNRRAIDHLLQLEEHRVRRLDATLSVLMVDLDHFKRVNDTLGHAAGDQALQHLAAVMAANLRQIDHVARWGGEEFLAMLPATGDAEALVLAERLRERIRDAVVVVDNQRLTLTASIGVATWDGSHDSREALVARADAALYAAKRDGRDRVRRHTPVPMPARLGDSAAA